MKIQFSKNENMTAARLASLCCADIWKDRDAEFPISGIVTDSINVSSLNA